MYKIGVEVFTVQVLGIGVVTVVQIIAHRLRLLLKPRRVKVRRELWAGARAMNEQMGIRDFRV
jgi:hypothetical protein